jgi:MSHA pilin protein MshD
MSLRRRSRGVSLIEVVILIVVVAIGFMALFVLQSSTVQTTIDPVVRKQALAIASSLMEEIQLRGFTFCDPDDANVYTARDITECSSVALREGLGLEAGDSHAARSTLDNVSDYSGLPAMSGAGIVDLRGIPISATDLAGYTVTVAVTNVAGGELTQFPDTTDGLKITVSVTAPAGVSVSLQGYRLRYAPNSP